MHIKLTLLLEQAQGTATRPRVPDTLDDGSGCEQRERRSTRRSKKKNLKKKNKHPQTT